MSEIADKIRTFVEDCIAEYPEEADRIEVSISSRWGKCRVYLSKVDSPFFYSREIKLEEIKARPNVKAIASEVYTQGENYVD